MRAVLARPPAGGPGECRQAVPLSPWERFSASGTGRTTLAGTAAFVLCMAAVLGLAVDGVLLGIFWAALLYYSIYGLCYVLLTLRAFWGADPHRLGLLLGSDRDRRRGPLRSALVDSDGPSTTITFGLIALGAVVVSAGAERPLHAGTAVLLATTVVASWITAPVTYAVHYASLQARHPGLVFPGDEEPVFTDFLYFACSVATTLGTTDVLVTDARMRRTVTGQTLLAFAWNTVVVALLVVALTR